MGLNFTILDTALLVLGFFLLHRYLTRQRRPPLPPGPPGLPIIGNLLDMPSEFEWEVFSKWGEKWGDLLSVSVFGTTMVIVNSYEYAVEMLDKKGRIYSDRPSLPMLTEIMEMKDTLGLLPYDKTLRSSRRMFHEELGSSAGVRNYYPQEEELARCFLKHVMNDPDRLLEHCFQHAGSIILRVAYGYRTQDGNDPVIAIANKLMDHFAKASAPGGFLVNQFPLLLRVPDWFPGTGWKRTGREWAKDFWGMVDVPFDIVKKSIEDDSAEPSFTERWLRKNISPETEKALKHASGSLFGAASDTTSVTIYVFFLMMAKHPAIQKRAQAEIDAVCGRDKLPSFEHRDSLPFLRVVYKEVLRIHAVVPLALPHCTVVDDVHDGMFIPKGSVVLTNIWNMTHDPSVYKNPFDFDPDRFLGDAPERDPAHIVFGFGRRICPGRLLADASLYITLAMTLAAFDISPVTSTDGARLELKSKSGTLSHIHPFECRITPRMDRTTLSGLLEIVQA